MVNGLEIAQFVPRPGFGKAGQSVKVAVNSYRVTKFPSMKINQYDVSIGKGDEKRALIKKIWFSDQIQNLFGNAKGTVLFDGNKLAWSIVPLPFGDQHTCVVDLDEGDTRPRKVQRENKHRVVIKKSGNVPLQVTQAYVRGEYALDNDVLVGINFLDHLMRETPSKHFITIKRSFFQNKGNQQLDGGVEAWKGIFQSVRATQGGSLTINVDVATAVFWQHGTVLSVLQRLLKIGSPEDLANRLTTPQGTRDLRRMKKVQFTIKHRGQANDNKRFSIEGFSKSADDTKFEFGRDGKTEQMSVSTYYYKNYNIRLKYPQLPLIQTKKKNVLFPMELAFVVEGQRYPFKLDDRQTADMIKFTVQRPNVRSEAIKSNVAQLDWKNDPILRQYGMEISPEMIKTQARVLRAPKIQYGTGSQDGTFVPRDGRWDLRGKKFAKVTSQLHSWGVMVCAPPRRVPEEMVRNFVREFIKAWVGHGGQCTNKDPVIMFMNPNKPLEQSVQEFYNATGNKVKARPQILFFVLQQKSAQPYNNLKNICDTKLGVVSQCVQSRHVEQAKGQYCSNVCMKVNSKLGGTTVFLEKDSHPLYGKEPTLIIGADVSHGGAFGGGGMKAASYACMVGSTDLQGARYAAICNTNGHRVEVITTKNVLKFVKELLRAFRKNTTKVPARIIYFRDGVSEGQYAQIVEQELEDIKQACREIQAGYKPLITVVVCTKRHHSRFFPVDRAGSDRNGNVVPGTIIERDITHPTEYDFFLCSHAAIQGTARATRYTIIYDDNKMPIDALQGLIYNSTYTYARATNAVSLVPAVYYAHLASARARAHDVNTPAETPEATPSGVSSLPPMDFEDLTPIHAYIGDSMWYI